MNLKTYLPQDNKAKLKESKLYADFKLELFDLHKPDAHLVCFEGAEALACCSVWWQFTPDYEGRKLGCIGHFAAHSEEAAKMILDSTCRMLQEQNCSFAVGPMDGSTWRSYRFATEGESGAFFLEPANPQTYPHYWQGAGFEVLAEYLSALQKEIPVFPSLSKRIEDLAQKGIQIRQLNLNNIDAELERVYDLTLKSFSNNFLYTVLDKNEFLLQYQQILPFVMPELVLLAEKDDQLVAYMFALPDLAQKQRGEALTSFIIKTIATHPELMGQGIAGTLTQKVMQNAKALGFSNVIHALIFAENASLKISNKYSQETLRRYALYSKNLAV